MFSFGKYKGRTYSDIAKVDPAYCQWLCTCDIDDKEKTILTNLVGLHSIYLSFGKYKGKKLEEVYEIDESYVEWLSKQSIGTSSRPDIIKKAKELVTKKNNS